MKVTGLEVILPTNNSQGVYIPQHPIGGLESPIITKRRSDEKGKNIISYSGDLVFTGADTDFIKSYLVDHPSAIENYIIIHMDDECCGNKYKFMMQPDQIDWCFGECELSATPKEFSPDNEIFKCLDSKTIFDDTFASQIHPRIMFCKEIRPDWLQVVILIAGILFDLVAVLIIPAIIAIQVVITAVCVVLAILTFGIFNCVEDTFFVDDYFHWLGELQKSIVGCGYKTPSPLVREYVANGCNKCGAQFESHIFTNPQSDYYNSVYFYNPTIPGLGIDDQNTYWMAENTPLQSTIQYLDKLKEMFNGKYEIKNGVLRFERRDWFQNQPPWLDLNALPEKNIVKECYTWNGDKRFAYANLKYGIDGYDEVGEEAMGRRFSDIIEWNSPPSPMQSGSLDLTFPFAPNRYRQDGVGVEAGFNPPLDTDILGSFEWFVGYAQNIQDSLDYLIVGHSGHSTLPKLLIWDPESGTQFGKVKKSWNVPGWTPAFVVTAPPFNDGQHGRFPHNYPYWIREDLPGYDAPAYPSCLNNSTYPGNLYNRFWYIENPRLSLYRGLDSEIEIIWDCDILNQHDINGTMRGRAYTNNHEIEEIVIDYGNHKMTIKGKL